MSDVRERHRKVDLTLEEIAALKRCVSDAVVMHEGDDDEFWSDAETGSRQSAYAKLEAAEGHE